MAQRLELDPPRLVGDPATLRRGFASLSNTVTRSFGFGQRHAIYGQGSGGAGKVRFGWRTGRAGFLETIGQPVRISIQPIAGRQPGCLRRRAWLWPRGHLGAGAGACR